MKGVGVVHPDIKITVFGKMLSGTGASGCCRHAAKGQNSTHSQTFCDIFHLKLLPAVRFLDKKKLTEKRNVTYILQAYETALIIMYILTIMIQKLTV